METFSALLAICAGNLPVTVEFPAQRPVTRSFEVFFDLCLNKRSKQSWGWWFEMPSYPLWRHSDDYVETMFWYDIMPVSCTQHHEISCRDNTSGLSRVALIQSHTHVEYRCEDRALKSCCLCSKWAGDGTLVTRQGHSLVVAWSNILNTD